MGFTSQDDLLAKITAGQYQRVEMSKITTPVHTAGGWHLLTALAGYPNAGTWQAAADLTFQCCSEVGGDGAAAPILIGPQIGGALASPATRHLINIGAMMVAAAGAPWQLKLVDLQGYYLLSGANVTGTGSRTLVNSNTFTASSSNGLLLTYANDWANFSKVRFTTTATLPTGLSLATDYWLVRASATTAHVATSLINAVAGTFVAYTDTGSGTHTLTMFMPRYDNGVGCEACFVVKTQPTAGGPQLSASNYDNTVPTSARAFQGTPVMNATANAYAARIIHSGNAAGNYGAFLPKQGGDLGIARINSFTWSGGTAYTGTGVVALCIVKPLADIALPVTGMWSERDLVNQLPSLPEIKSGACLQWMLFGTGATTNNSPFAAAIDLAYGP